MQATNRFGTFCAVTLAAAGLLGLPAANAQQQSPSAPPVTTPSPTTTPATIADKKLDAAAAADKKVTVIKNKYNQQLAEAPVAAAGHQHPQRRAGTRRPPTGSPAR